MNHDRECWDENCTGECWLDAPQDRAYREWSEMKAEGIEIETMQEYVDEVRGFNDYDEPEPYDPYDDPFD